jgi:hypothetical protein
MREHGNGSQHCVNWITLKAKEFIEVYDMENINHADENEHFFGPFSPPFRELA